MCSLSKVIEKDYKKKEHTDEPKENKHHPRSPNFKKIFTALKASSCGTKFRKNPASLPQIDIASLKHFGFEKHLLSNV